MMLLDDASQHRKSSDAHGNTHEQGERQKAELVRCVLVKQDQRQCRAQHERHDDAEVRNQQSRLRPGGQGFEIELEPDHEHEKNEADVA